VPILNQTRTRKIKYQYNTKMTPVLISVDKAGDLKLGRKKCRLHKKADVVKVAKKYGIVNPDKLTIKELCVQTRGAHRRGALPRGHVRGRTASELDNKIPLAKLYPEVAKKRAAAKKRAEKKALDKKVAANFMKGMTTKIASPKRIITIVKVTPSKKAKSINKEEATKRIDRMKISGSNKNKLYEMMYLNQRSPRHVVRVARELARLR